MDINQLVNVTSRSWSLNILAQLHRGVVGKQAALIRACGASRTAFSQSLAHLIDAGLLERNPGYGHPLRPEFRLTIKGMEAAELADKILFQTPNQNANAILRRTWVVPILGVIDKPTSFGGIKRAVGSISDRALSQTIQLLETESWVHRQIDISNRTPRPLYHSINHAAEISRVLQSFVGR